MHFRTEKAYVRGLAGGAFRGRQKKSFRACTKGILIEPGTKPLTLKKCVSDAIRLWNNAPAEICNANSIYSAKRTIKTFVKTLTV